MKKIKLLLLLILSAAKIVLAGESSVLLIDQNVLPSNDLVYEGKVLTSKEANTLKAKKHLDLSSLDPQENDLWTKEESTESLTSEDDKIAVDPSDILDFQGSILSNTGLYRFNVTSTTDGQFYTVHLEKSLHSMLMRKNLLRKIGYKVPGMKYLKSIQIRFSSLEDLNKFLKKEIPENTLGAPERWYNESASNINDLVITLKDVAVTMPSKDDFYNLSQGIPTSSNMSRTIRSLVIPYSLVDLYESVNLFPWNAGRVENKAVVLTHFTNNSFYTAKDDALWILNRINKLERKDFEEIVAKSYFPMSVEKILIEKIISRRNSLNKLFDVKASVIKFDHKVNYGDDLQKGKLKIKVFPEYASRFSYKDAESPLEQMKYYVFAKIQSNIINNAISYANQYLEYNEANDKRKEYYDDLFKKGLDHFVKTGELLPIEVGTWAAPVANGQLILSRDIVLGNYLGTNNLVQLSDTFGAGIDAGVILGIEGLNINASPHIKSTVSYVRTYSHLRPVKNLKESLKEPYKNMFVPFLKKNLQETFKSLSDLKNENAAGKKDDELKKKVADLLEQIEKNLGVGESLIITDRFMPSASLKVNFNQGLLTTGIGLRGGALVAKRIHIYKNGPKQLKIFDDRGFIKEFDLTLDVSKYITILSANLSMDYGKYSLKSYDLDFSNETSNDVDNLNIYTKSLAVYNLIKNRNFELVEMHSKANEVESTFKDRTSGLSLLWFKLKSLYAETFYKVKASNGSTGQFYSLEHNKLSGISPESFTKQVLNYYISKQVEDVRIYDDLGSQNPANSFLGRSNNKTIRYEAKIENNGFTHDFLTYSVIKQGWAIKQKDALKFIENVNQKFERDLFNRYQIDFTKLRLFKIGYHINLYENGYERLQRITSREIDLIEDSYRKKSECHPTDEKYSSRECGDLSYIKSKIISCQKLIRKGKDQSKITKCSMQLFDGLFNDLEFSDFLKLMKEDNMYIYATIDGFREKSEILNDTIYSNTVGRIGSKQWRGPIEEVSNILGLSKGELEGSWIRESI